MRRSDKDELWTQARETQKQQVKRATRFLLDLWTFAPEKVHLHVQSGTHALRNWNVNTNCMAISTHQSDVAPTTSIVRLAISNNQRSKSAPPFAITTHVLLLLHFLFAPPTWHEFTRRRHRGGTLLTHFCPHALQHPPPTVRSALESRVVLMHALWQVVVVFTHSGFTRSVLLAVGREPYRPQNTELVPAIVFKTASGSGSDELGIDEDGGLDGDDGTVSSA
jgi:hypothetical protein